MEPITGLVLAGGLSRRMGRVDKGLTLLRGRPMVAWVLERLAPQVSEIIVNANQNLERYREFGYHVVSDAIGDFAGPLAGLQAGLLTAAHSLVLTVPCDSPFLPADLAKRLHRALGGADLAVAKSGGRTHPVFALCRRELLPRLSDYLARGGRKVDAWYAKLEVVEVAFDDEPDAFCNINTLDELRAFDPSA